MMSVAWFCPCCVIFVSWVCGAILRLCGGGVLAVCALLWLCCGCGMAVCRGEASQCGVWRLNCLAPPPLANIPWSNV